MVGGCRYRIGRPDYALGLMPATCRKAPPACSIVAIRSFPGDETGCLALFSGLVTRCVPSRKVWSPNCRRPAKVVLLTGDAPGVAARVGNELGIDDAAG